MMTVEDVKDGGRVLPMARWGTSVMHGRTRPVTVFDEELLTLVRDMFATMRASGGVGLAATQVGVDLAVFPYTCPDAKLEHLLHHLGVHPGTHPRRTPGALEDLRSGTVCNPAVALPQG